MLSCIFIVLLLSEVADGEVFVTDHEANFSLASLASHLAAEASEIGQIGVVMDVGGRRIAVDHDRLVLDQDVASVAVPPTPFALGSAVAPLNTRTRISGPESAQSASW